MQRKTAIIWVSSLHKLSVVYACVSLFADCALDVVVFTGVGVTRTK